MPAHELTGARAASDYIGFDMEASLGAGDTPMDVFLNGVGMAVHVGPIDLPFRGLHSTIRVSDSFELGDVMFRLAGIQELSNAISIEEKRFGQAG